MLISYKRSQTSVVLRVKIRSTSTGEGLTGLTSASSGLIIGTIANNEASSTAYTVASSNVETISTLGTYAAPTSGKARFKEVDATNHPGIYEVQLANSRFAVTSAKDLLVTISGASGMAQCDALVPLVDLDPYTALSSDTTMQAVLALINPARIVANTGLTAENKEIYAGADYNSSDTNRALQWSVDDVDLTSGTVAFSYMLTSTYEAGGGSWTSLGSGSVTAYSSGTNTIKVSLTAAQVATLTTVTPPADKFAYTYKLEVTLSSRVRRSVIGGLNVVQ